MNKIGAAIGAATLVAFAGCLNPNYVKKHPEMKGVVPGADGVETAQAAQPGAPAGTVAQPRPVSDLPGTGKPQEIKPVQPPAADPVIIDATPVAPPPPTPAGAAHGNLPPPPPAAGAALPPPAQPETTDYIVQRDDTISRISKRYNIKISSIRAVNPQLKGDTIRVGQKLKLPGKVDVGEQKVPAGAIAAPAAPRAAAAFKPYTGETAEYTVKNGDTLGGIAYKNGISIRQLRELNGGLPGDLIRVGSKLKVPAAPVVKSQNAKGKDKPKADAKAAQPAADGKKEAKPAVEKKPEAAKENGAEPEAAPAAAPEQPAEPAVAEPAQAPAPEQTDYIVYTVKENEDITGIAILFEVERSDIRELNNLPPEAVLTPGMKIKIPKHK